MPTAAVQKILQGPLFRTQRDARMWDTDNRQRLGAILARLRAVAASPSAQPGRLPEGDVTASAAQLDTRSAWMGCDW
eukprot:scaffold13732_cov147-Isochrysis_galbana.AAC.1